MITILLYALSGIAAFMIMYKLLQADEVASMVMSVVVPLTILAVKL